MRNVLSLQLWKYIWANKYTYKTGISVCVCVCIWYVHDMYLICIWYVYDMYMICICKIRIITCLFVFCSILSIHPSVCRWIYLSTYLPMIRPSAYLCVFVHTHSPVTQICVNQKNRLIHLHIMYHAMNLHWHIPIYISLFLYDEQHIVIHSHTKKSKDPRKK